MNVAHTTQPTQQYHPQLQSSKLPPFQLHYNHILLQTDFRSLNQITNIFSQTYHEIIRFKFYLYIIPHFPFFGKSQYLQKKRIAGKSYQIQLIKYREIHILSDITDKAKESGADKGRAAEIRR